MADTPRTRAALIALLADNVTGQISAQDVRDVLVTVMEEEFVNPGDFWKAPDHQQMTQDTVRGWIDYSQLISEACSFGNILERQTSGQWVLASGLIGSINSNFITLGVACDSYAISTFGNVLRRGLVYNSEHSASFDQEIGRPVYYASDVAGSITLVEPTSAICLGFVEIEASGGSTSNTNIWRFEPACAWGIVGT